MTFSGEVASAQVWRAAKVTVGVGFPSDPLLRADNQGALEAGLGDIDRVLAVR